MPATAEGYAVVSAEGELLISTVSPHRRAAIVNWLWVVPRVRVMDHATDEQIEEGWHRYSGNATLRRVRVTVIED